MEELANLANSRHVTACHGAKSLVPKHDKTTDLKGFDMLWYSFGPGETTSLSYLSIPVYRIVRLSFIQHSKRFNIADQKQYAFVSLVVSRPTCPPSLGGVAML